MESIRYPTWPNETWTHCLAHSKRNHVQASQSGFPHTGIGIILRLIDFIGYSNEASATGLSESDQEDEFHITESHDLLIRDGEKIGFDVEGIRQVLHMLPVI